MSATELADRIVNHPRVYELRAVARRFRDECDDGAAGNPSEYWRERRELWALVCELVGVEK